MKMSNKNIFLLPKWMASQTRGHHNGRRVRCGNTNLGLLPNISSAILAWGEPRKYAAHGSLTIPYINTNLKKDLNWDSGDRKQAH